MPRTSPFILPCEPVRRERLPLGEWLYEVKFDGYRFQVHKDRGDVRLFTRRGHDWTDRFPTFVGAIRGLKCQSVIMDAELAHEDSFEDLHLNVHKRHEDGWVLWCFDLMHLDGKDTRTEGYVHRKRRLRALLERTPVSELLYSESFKRGERLLAECERRGLEGVVAKRPMSFYSSGPSKSWIKVKCPGWRKTSRNRGELLFGGE